jgi:hypothetical protein
MLLIVALFIAAAGMIGAWTMTATAAPPPSGGPDCSIVLCIAPPPTCPPGFKLGIPAGQCCPVCVRAR